MDSLIGHLGQACFYGALSEPRHSGRSNLTLGIEHLPRPPASWALVTGVELHLGPHGTGRQLASLSALPRPSTLSSHASFAPQASPTWGAHN